MAVKHLYTLLCDYAFEDAAGKSNFMGVFQNILLTAVPGAIPQFFLVVGVTTDQEADVEISVASADKAWELPPYTQHLPNLAATPTESVTLGLLMIRLANVTFPAAGTYQILLSSNGEVIHSLPFGVLVQETQDAASPA